MMALQEIGIPPAVEDLLRLPRGLILVTGPTQDDHAGFHARRDQ
jgi:Tfp pilus assembly pilus retraction ATPase PilT